MDHRYPKRQSRLDSSIDRKSVKSKNLTLLNKLSLKKSKDKSLSRELENHNKTANAVDILELREDPTVASQKSESPASKNISLNNDSLQDFRSPEKNDENKIDIDCGFQLAGPTKKNVSLVYKSSKSGTKQKHCPQEISRNENQLSIESSFFKPKMSAKCAFVCPLCFKTFNEANAKNNHVKSCAAKNKISTKKLLDAVALQEKQSEERKAMGLLAAPTIQPKKHISRKMISDKDPQLQIGIALSMSLHEAQEAELMEQQYNLGLAETVDYNIKTLQNFGFVTSKPLDSSRAARLKKKRITGPTLLQTRTQEERNRLITDRIAEILMGDEAVTQAMLENAKEVIAARGKIIMKSKLLQSYHCTDNRLWDKTQLALNSKNLYFCDLLGISPYNTKDDTDIQMMQESQIDHVASVEYKCDSPKPINEKCYSPTKELEGKAENHSNAVHAGDKKTERRNRITNLSKDWATFLNLSSMSDVIIFVKDDNYIYAHKLVFFVRCSNILSDLDSLNDTKFYKVNEKICWLNTDRRAALAFLEFIYCDVIAKNSCIFEDQVLLTSVRILARKYQVKDLFSYLRDKQNELKFNEEKNVNLRSSPTNIEFHGNDLIEYQLDGSCILQENRTSMDRSDCIASKEPFTNNHGANEHTFSEIDVSLLDGNKERSIPHSSMIENASSSCNTLLDDIDFSSMTTQSPKTAIQFNRISTVQDETTEKFPEHQIATETFPSNATTYNCETTDKSNNDLGTSYEQKRSISPDIFDESTLEYPITITRDAEQNQGDSNASTIDGIKMLDGNQNRSEIEVLDLCEDMDVHKAATSVEFGTELTQTSEKCSPTFKNVSTRRKKKERKSIDDEKLTSNLEDRCNTSAELLNIAEPLTKQKSDITLAIEKIQRLNAKSASDSDSDFEFPLTPLSNQHGLSRPRAKNNTSFLFDRDANRKAPFKVVDEVQSKKRTALSMFEQKIKDEAAMNRTEFGLVSHKSRSNLECGESNKSSNTSKILTNKSDDNIIDLSQDSAPKLVDPVHTILDLTQESSEEVKSDTNSEEEDDLSIFSKYKRKHSHNSIDKYRNALKRNIQSESSNNRNCDENSSTNDFNHSAFRQKVSDDTELSPKPVKMDNHSKLLTKTTESRKSDEHFSTILDETELSDLEINLSNSFSTRYRNTSTKVGIAIDKSNSNSMKNERLSQRFRDEGKQTVENEEPVESLIDISLSDTEFTILKNVDSENKNDHLFDQDTDVDCSIHRDDRDRSNILDDDCTHQMKEKEQVYHNSPTKFLKNESKLNRNRIKQFSFDDDLRNKHMKHNSTNSQISIEPTTSRVCISYDSDSDTIVVPFSCQTQGSDVPKHDNKNLAQDSESSDEESYKLSLNKRSITGSSSHGLKKIRQAAKRLRGSSVSPKESPKTSIRSLTAKSVSENLFMARSVERNRSSNNFNNDELSRQQSTPNRKRKISDDSNENTPRNMHSKIMTPSGIYSTMRTPDLSRELDKYGLKKQSREKAKQLLRYIHNELHSSAPDDKSGQSGYNKSLRKGDSGPNDVINKVENQDFKICGGENSHKLRSNNTSKNKNVEINDHLSFEESSSDDSITLSQSNTTETLEEAFSRLLRNDRHLHNKILTYEPLHLENIHATLRAQGIKCSRKAIMNLLHDQCITFRTMINEKRNRAKHKRSPSKH